MEKVKVKLGTYIFLSRHGVCALLLADGEKDTFCATRVRWICSGLFAGHANQPILTERRNPLPDGMSGSVFKIKSTARAKR